MLGTAALVIALSQSDDSRPERGQNNLYSDGLGVVAAFTATARAGGGVTIDPTALATPNSTRIAPTEPMIPDESEMPVSSPSVRVQQDEVAPGGSMLVSISGAAPNESFDIALKTVGNVASGETDAAGEATALVNVPNETAPQKTELEFTGSTSGPSSVEITISADAPVVSADPADVRGGETVEITAQNFEPGESITVELSGHPVASGIAGNDGNLSANTALPELQRDQAETLVLSAEGSTGSLAVAPVNVSEGAIAVPSATEPVSSGDSNESSPNVQDGEQMADDHAINDLQESSISLSDLPRWLYFAAGAVVGWLAVLTLWVMRLDRHRDRWVAAVIDDRKSLSQGPESQQQAAVELGDTHDDQTAA